MIDDDPRMEALRKRYAASLADKRAALAAAWETWRAAGDSAVHLRELATQAHRLAGSAGSYGYTEIGACACALDRLVVGPQDSTPGSAASIDEAVRALLDAIDAAQARR